MLKPRPLSRDLFYLPLRPVVRYIAFIFLSSFFTSILHAQGFTFSENKPITVIYSANGPRLDSIAASFLAADIRAAMNNTVYISTDTSNIKGDLIIIGAASSQLLKHYLPVNSSIHQQLKDKWECYAWKTITNPFDNRSKAFIITGSDTRGTAYGVFKLSERLGVSPWYWWADVPVLPQKAITIAEKEYISSSPSVKYRGIFLNDEDWGLTPWSTHNFESGLPLIGKAKGTIGPKTYARIFELLLRLRANSIWPAMHEATTAFYLTPGNKEEADKYNIVVGTSHCEPLMRNSAAEWDIAGKGDYNYVTNKNGMLSYWEERLKDLKHSENLFTIGLRGKHDGQMQGVKTPEENKAVLSEVIRDQRFLLQKHRNSDISKVPQVFIPYKEVLDAYNNGLAVPDDITLIWCDDNYGYITHFPDEKEQARGGGNGVYYHASYWGRPHDYLWLGSANPALMYYQMQLAYEKKAREVWILNVGDIKPLEYQMELFMDMGWDMNKVQKQTPSGHLLHWLSREFGLSQARKILPVMQEYYRLAYIRKPEFMGNTRVEEKDPAYTVVRDLPWSEIEIRDRLHAYVTLSSKVEEIARTIPHIQQAAFFELIQYPVQAAAQMNQKLLSAQLARHNKTSWEQSDLAYDSIIALTNRYNSLLNGKWNGMMDCQPRKLPVFAKPPHESVQTSLPGHPNTAFLLNGTDFQNPGKMQENTTALGYEGKAAILSKGIPLLYELGKIVADSILIEVRLLPNHPVSGESLRFRLKLNNETSAEISYKTQGRSEEWKENVLRNQAIRQVTLPVSRKGPNRLIIEALDEGVVLDQVVIYGSK